MDSGGVCVFLLLLLLDEFEFIAKLRSGAVNRRANVGEKPVPVVTVELLFNFEFYANKFETNLAEIKSSAALTKYNRLK